MIRNVLFTFLTKGAVAIIGILLVPVFIKILTPSEFGIWQTLTSIISWFYFLDIGVGNGFRNSFARSIAENDTLKARKYLSTTYAVVGLVSLSFLLLFEIINPFLYWNHIMNAPDLDLNAFNWVVQFVFISFCLKLFLSVLNTTLIANQQYFTSSLTEVFGNFFILIFTSILLYQGIHSLVWVSFFSSIFPVLILLLATFYFFQIHSLKKYLPSIQLVEFALAKELFNKGIQFFFIQIAFVLMFTANNIVIAQLFGPESVGKFSIANKYFSIPLIGFGIIMGPFWSGFTVAYAKNEIEWVEKTVYRLLLIWGGFLILIWGMYIYFDEITTLWIGSPQNIDRTLVFYFAIFVSVSTFNHIFSYFLNGVGVIRVQLYGSAILGIISIPLSIFLCKVPELGVNGVIVSNIICLFFGTLLGPFQYYLLIRKKAKGIWLK